MNNDEITRFLAEISCTCHDWQVQQAQESIQLYLHYQRRPNSIRHSKPAGIDRLWSGAVEQMVSLMRLKHMSYRTEETYLSWIRQFYRQVKGVAPNRLNTDHVIGFLTYLAVDRKVSRATWTQAFHAILFFYRQVLKHEIGDLWKSMRAKQRQRLPVVLSTDEIRRVLDNVRGLPGLMLQIIYGGGLRLAECLRLRVKDLDFDRGCMVIRASKGDQNRESILLESLILPLEKHLPEIKSLSD